MALTGYLSEYSLVEIFQFIQQGYKTGLLLVEPDSDLGQSTIFPSYIWFRNGRIVSHARDLSQLGLLVMIDQRGWAADHNLSAFHQQFKKMNKPLGLYLKAQGVLDTEQLRLLFRSQVLQPVCGLFKLVNARFSFDEQVSIAYPEMTGLSMTAGEASLLGLRVLRDWTFLERKLPAPEFGLQKLRSEPPALKLDTQEMQVWELATGEISIAKIAKKTHLELIKVQQIGFRLAAVGLVQEIALELASPELAELLPTNQELAQVAVDKPALSKSFMSNLVGFLKKRV
jgi:Domain of unknown function (DUF4388)